MKLPLYLRRVVGHSMEPTLKTDQILLIGGWLKPRPDDLVMAKVGGQEVIKRASSIDNGGVSLISDNANHGFYARVDRALIYGKVVKIF